MPDYYEIDFRQVHTTKSGDAIGIRYQIGEHWYVHLVDGGYTTTAPEISNFWHQGHQQRCRNAP